MSESGAQSAAPRALVVDDDLVARIVAARALGELGFLVEQAEDGAGALAAVELCRPDLVLLDLEMPGLDGFGTCEALREQYGTHELPILIMTGHTDETTIDRAFEVGATDFLRKPIDPQLLQHRVRFVMRAYEAFEGLGHTLADLRASQKRLANAQRLARVGNWEWVVAKEEMVWSEQLHRILGVEPTPGSASLAALIGGVHPSDREDVEKALWSSAREAEIWSMDHRVVNAEGQTLSVHHQVEVTLGASGAPETVSGTVQDVTERRLAEQQIRYLSSYDSLTALPNRRTLSEHLVRLLSYAEASNEEIAVLCLDLDRFKRVNDTLGHAFGDELLKTIAERLVECVRTTDYVGRTEPERPLVSRLGGDEFTVVLKGVGGPDSVSIAARRLLDYVKRPFHRGDEEVVMSATVGISLFPHDASDGDGLLRNAEAAMHAAKDDSRDSFRFFDGSMNERALRELSLERHLRSAVSRGELAVHYQPLLDAETGRVGGVEALLRWMSPQFGAVSPDEFVPLAEKTGLIESVGEWVLRRACEQLAAWRDEGVPDLRLAVNVSSQQVRRPGLVEAVEDALRASRMEPQRLELEITESALMSDEPIVLESLRRLRALGVHLALDDYGTGYSSLSHLVRFPIDIVKIDRSFVSGIDEGEQGSAIIAAVIAMAHRLGMRVTAEGVETATQDEFLRDEGCDVLQGFRFARPLDPEALAAFLRNGNS